MGLISTGLGFTQASGELSQEFCIPEGISQIRVSWRFLSEEFREYCGFAYQDTFHATLTLNEGQSNEQIISIQKSTVDSLCYPEDCSGCGDQFGGLEEACVAFDQGGVWATPWRETVADISAFAGAGPVVLRFFATDIGDSGFDTAILLDDIRFE